MSGVPYLVFFFISHLLILCLAQEEKGSSQKCQHFDCKIFGNLSLPFSNETYPDCGFLTIEGCNEQVQTIRLGKDGLLFHVTCITKDNTLLLQEKPDYEKLFDLCCCVEYLKNFTILSSPILSFEVLPKNQILFQCPGSPYTAPEDYGSLCNDCNHSIIYYNGSNHGELLSPLDCSPIPLQMNNTPKGVDYFNVYTGWFRIQVNVTKECLDCNNRGSQCRIDNQRNFQCPKPRKENGLLKIGIGVGNIPLLSNQIILWFSSLAGNKICNCYLCLLGIGVGGLAVLIVVLLIWFIRRRKKQKYDNFNSRYTASNPSSNSELQLGSAYYGVPIFSYTELAEATNNFSEANEVGDGGFGTVYYAKLRDEREVAVKRLYEHNHRRHQQFMNEIKILTHLRHKNLVSLYGCTPCDSPQGLLLVYEYVNNGTVADHLHGDRAKPGPLTWPIRLNIAIETASALVYLHASDIIHRDVKTHNILLDNNFCVKVADFGLSRWFPNNVTHVSTAPQGSPGYVDPEYHQCYRLTDKSDVYSFGVVLIELISSMPAVDINRHRHEVNLANFAMNRIQKRATEDLIDPSFGYQSDAEVKRMTTSVAELAFLCLQQNKEMRPAMDEILEELKRIESGESKLKSVQQPPDCDDLALMKHIQLPSSPISVTTNWVSSDTTSNVSG
ncbi:LEAF RUST 10 DISEASE-RESISTANCE LOCUS RECEPTOR-LIKE PROTEIN KINASE-like 1.1 [Pistacia vera]|uniref:LEAF RUST 10 DISEASE-RESISTANCE LOCUS RECEPTOR-LIKE PROTEIN KINASE-like 1.1 n=1 Tax=Pistacia vera TaxID=55513 RepID=UPI0012636696|nr:LEAF RUST 10 DISEASE-RESISTANCE LOCUS RECEPTOR-LIKE PROTEIN KINASE-like 1.1 [Pistacia vera]